MNNELATIGIVNFDFQNVFPYKFWISNWLTDESYPAAVCYKILSVRDEPSNRAQVVLVRSFRDGAKEILHRAEVPFSEVESASQILTGGLKEKLNLNFEEQDFQTARTLSDFNRIASRHGWHIKPPD